MAIINGYDPATTKLRCEHIREMVWYVYDENDEIVAVLDWREPRPDMNEARAAVCVMQLAERLARA